MFLHFLKLLNSLPFRLTIKHYEKFDNESGLLKNEELNSAESWDVLRENYPHFSISHTRAEWLKASENLVKKDGQDGGLKKRAQEISFLLKELKIKDVFSVGVGGAGLEYQIMKNFPEIRLTCSEYSQANITLLKKVFTECPNIIFFDIKEGDWRTALTKNDPKHQLCLLYRVDPHLTDIEWRKVFENMYAAGIENILFIPCNFLTVRGVFNRIIKRVNWKLKNIRYSFSGFLRTKKRFQSFWFGLYKEQNKKFGGLDGFLLRRY